MWNSPDSRTGLLAPSTALPFAGAWPGADILAGRGDEDNDNPPVE